METEQMTLVETVRDAIKARWGEPDNRHDDHYTGDAIAAPPPRCVQGVSSMGESLREQAIAAIREMEESPDYDYDLADDARGMVVDVVLAVIAARQPSRAEIERAIIRLKVSVHTLAECQGFAVNIQNHVIEQSESALNALIDRALVEVDDAS